MIRNMESIGTIRIETERLILRRFTLEDAPAMYERWASDPEVTKYLTWQPHESVETSRDYLADLTSKYDRGDFFDWAIELKGVGVIGSIGVVNICKETEQAEIGYCISRAHWGKGIVPEALKAVIDFLFDEAHFRRVFAKHDVDNPRSGRAMEKAGMKYEGTLRQAGRNNRGIIDVVIRARLAEDR